MDLSGRNAHIEQNHGAEFWSASHRESDKCLYVAHSAVLKSLQHQADIICGMRLATAQRRGGRKHTAAPPLAPRTLGTRKNSHREFAVSVANALVMESLLRGYGWSDGTRRPTGDTPRPGLTNLLARIRVRKSASHTHG